jgi:hypothetical protein
MLSAKTMRFGFFIARLLVSVAMTSAPLTGQALVPGARLRVTHKDHPRQRLIGTLERVAHDTIYLRLEDERQSTVLPLPLVTIGTAEVNRGRHSHAVRGGVGGGAILGGGCLLLGLKFQREQAPFSFTKHDVALLTIVGAASGAYIGARIGSWFHSEKWEVIPVTSLQVATVISSRVGFRVSLRL